MTDNTAWPGSYEANGVQIYRESFATIRAEAAADLAGMPDDAARVLVRMIHSSGMTDLAKDFAYSPNAVKAARQALLEGAPVLCDAQMVASGITRARLPRENEIVCTLNAPGVPELAEKLKTTRSAAAIDFWMNNLEGSVVAIGNAPTALFRLLELIRDGPRARLRSSVFRWVSSAQQSPSRRWRRIRSVWNMSWCTVVAVVAR